MKSIRRAFRPHALLLGFAVLAASWSGARSQEDLDCRPVIENFRQNVESAPSHVLTLLEDALIANGGHCVPDFVKTAIESSNADAKMVKKIVFVAITNAQSQAPQIAEVAVAAAPKHADSVREAFAEAFEDSNPRLKPSKPADAPAWAQENAPVPPPTVPPAPKPRPEPVPEPAPKPITPIPAPATVARADSGNPYLDPSQSDEGWELLHDGVVAQTPPIDPQNLQAPPSPDPGPTPAAVEPPVPGTKKKLFGLSLPSLPPLPLPSLPELSDVSEPQDLFFHAPFGGIPPLEPGT